MDSTPDELEILATAAAENKVERLKLIITHAYYTAAFSRAKKLPRLKSLLDKIVKRQQKQKGMSDEAMLARVKAMNALLGGEVKGGEQ